MPEKEKCQECGGSGYLWVGLNGIPCMVCNGMGYKEKAPGDAA